MKFAGPMSSNDVRVLEADSGESGIGLPRVRVTHQRPGVAEGIQRTFVLICLEVSGASFNRERLGHRSDTYLFDFTIKTLFLDHGMFRVFPQAQVLQPPLLEQH